MPSNEWHETGLVGREPLMQTAHFQNYRKEPNTFKEMLSGSEEGKCNYNNLIPYSTNNIIRHAVVGALDKF